MRLVRGAGLAFFFGAIAFSGLSAQQSFGVAQMTSAGDSTPVAAAAEPGGCPVALHAQHLADGGLVKVRGDHPSGIGQGMGQWIHLTLANPPQTQVTGATVTVHGASGKGRLSTAQSTGGASADATQNLTVVFRAASDKEAAADLWVQGMTAVQRIEVRSLKYANGGVWGLSGHSPCSVTPDPYMLVAGR